MFEEDDLSCPVCTTLFTDPRMIPSCGHSFCSECIADWRKQSRECPVCRGDIGPIELPKNIALAGLVDRYKEQACVASNLCSNCSVSSQNCNLCQHCRSSFCPSCTEKHLKKLHSQLIERVAGLTNSLKKQESSMESVLLSQATLSEVENELTQVQAGSTAALRRVKSGLSQLDSRVQARLDAMHSARDSLTALEKISPTNAAAIARGIATANALADRLATDGKGDCGSLIDIKGAKKLIQLGKEFCAAASKILPLQLEIEETEVSQQSSSVLSESTSLLSAETVIPAASSRTDEAGVIRTNAPTASIVLEGPKYVGRTLYPCTGDSPAELSFEANQIVNDLQCITGCDDWYFGEISGRYGIIPKNYVQI